MLWCASNGAYAPSSARCASVTSCNPRTVENTVGRYKGSCAGMWGSSHRRALRYHDTCRALLYRYLYLLRYRIPVPYCSKTQGGAGRERGDTHRTRTGAEQHHNCTTAELYHTYLYSLQCTCTTVPGHGALLHVVQTGNCTSKALPGSDR